MTVDALLDGNVIIAALAQDHEHHDPSLSLLLTERAARFAVAAHSYAESYSILTRQSGPLPFHFSSGEVWAALESVAAVTTLIGLTPAQSFAAIRAFAQQGGIGARFYDRLIGETAVVHGLGTIVTWNVGHMRSLFPTLEVLTPPEFPGR